MLQIPQPRWKCLKMAPQTLLQTLLQCATSPLWTSAPSLTSQNLMMTIKTSSFRLQRAFQPKNLLTSSMLSKKTVTCSKITPRMPTCSTKSGVAKATPKFSLVIAPCSSSKFLPAPTPLQLPKTFLPVKTIFFLLRHPPLLI